MTATAAKASPWHDNLRHMYEAGRSVKTLAYYYNVTPRTMQSWLKQAGTALRWGKSGRDKIA